MRYFLVPPPITVTIKATEPDGSPKEQKLEVAFEQLCRTLADDPELGKGLPGVRASMSLMAAVEGKPVGSLVKLTDDAHNRIVEVLNKPTNGFVPAVMRHLLPMVDVILEADDEPPSVTKEAQ